MIRHDSKIRGLAFAVVATALMAGPGFVTAADRQDKPRSQVVLECLRGNIPERAAMGPVTVTRRNAAGDAKQYKWRVDWRMRNSQREVTIRVTAPDEVAGSAYLLRGTGEDRDVHLKSPAVEGVRRLKSGSGGGHKILGTDIAIQDVLGVGSALQDGTLTYMGEESVQGRTVSRMVALPPPGSDSSYSRITAYIGQDPCVIWRLELSSEGTLQKVYSAEPDSLRQTPSGVWYTAQWTLRDVRDDTSTTLRIDDLDTTPGFAKGRFETQSFYE